MSTGTRAAVDSFWEWLAFALNSAVFLLLGAEMSLGVLGAEWKLILLGALAALAARSVVVALIGALLWSSRERIPAAWLAVLAWGGLRGALSLVLALALPLDEPSRALVVGLTGGTVVFSLVGQGATMPFLLRRLGIAASGGALVSAPVSAPARGS